MSTPAEFLTSFSAAAGIALVVSVSNLGGFAGPYTFGLIRQRTGDPYYGLICAGIFFLISAAWALLLPKRLHFAPKPPRQADAVFEAGV
jgi:nitrate/nitrite transporter NarK